MNKVVHFEIPYDNKERVNNFYSKIFNWDLQNFPMEGLQDGYTVAKTTETDDNFMVKEPGAINGGMFKREADKLPTSPVITINVNSIDDYLIKITEAGGKMVAPKALVPDMGYFAYIKDTEGNTIGLWEDII